MKTKIFKLSIYKNIYRDITYPTACVFKSYFISLPVDSTKCLHMIVVLLYFKLEENSGKWPPDIEILQAFQAGTKRWKEYLDLSLVQIQLIWILKNENTEVSNKTVKET